mgnify:CR=1 FL=1
MGANELVTLIRDCEAALIPAGTPVNLPAGTQVVITQSLGGSYTIYAGGSLLRVDGRDADALGKEAAAAAPGRELTGDGTVQEEQLWEQMRTCYDPEIPINIVELGLIYGCQVVPLDGGNRVEVKMTLTAPGCGMGDILKQDVEHKLRADANVTEVQVEMVFDPPWDQSRMSEAARLQAGLL